MGSLSCCTAGALKTEHVEVGRAAMQQQQYAKPPTGHPTSPAMPSPLTPVDGASFYPSATDVDAKALMLSPRFNDVKPPALVALNSPAIPEPVAVVTNYTHYQQFMQAPPAVPAPGTTASVPGAPGSLLSDLDDIDALQCQWDMKHFEPGKLTESDLVCLDTAPTSSSTAVVSSSAPAVTTLYSTTTEAPGPDPPISFHPVFSSPVYHPYYQSQQQQQQIFSSEFNLDYSTPEVKELLCTGWLESDLLNVN